MKTIEVNVVECPFCSYEWIPRVENPRECPSCKRIIHEIEPPENWNSKCQICGKKFRNERGLRTHIGVKHKKDSVI